MVIKVERVSKEYRIKQTEPGIKGALKGLFYSNTKTIQAVKDISLTVNEKEIVGLLGANGAGKTTLLKLLTGLLYPTCGTISVLGYRPFERLPEFKKQITMVMGNKNQLWWDLPPIESFNLTKEIYQISNKEYKHNLEYLVNLFNIEDLLNTQVRNLSLGQRMKCELINSLLHFPKVIFLDEPTLGLDIISQKMIRQFIKKYVQENNATVIITSHYIQDITNLADRIVILNQGEKIYDNSLSEFIKEHQLYKKVTVFAKKLRILPDTWNEMLLESDVFKATYKIPNQLISRFLQEISAVNTQIENLVVEDVPIDNILEEYLGRAYN
ncbi:ABC transporter ATP-binding protein [Anoxybacter fermentans]|uniref:ABC transporter ATP-binding protein n=1 Tax=Anoxybacter fermentans TaxID=1323375 RepID=UPI0013E05683|nr:ATP-binding cassette domain-containing protein [Anoxybacter fermentans]